VPSVRDDRKMGIAASKRDQCRFELLMLVDVGQLAQVRTQVANVRKRSGSRQQVLSAAGRRTSAIPVTNRIARKA